MPNPFTRFLSQFSTSRDVDRLVNAWDDIEAIVIRVYKTATVTSEDAAAFQAAQAVLEREYPLWEAALRPHWQRALVAGQPARHDPFRRLFSADTPAAFIDNWDAMQHLPAAREALNRLVLSQSDSE